MMITRTLFILITLTLFTACQPPTPSARASQGASDLHLPAPRVTVAPVRAAPEHSTHVFTSRVSAPAGSAPAFTLAGRLTQLAVHTGDHVEQGDVIARLDAAPLEHARRAASSSLEHVDARIAQLEADLERAQKLLRNQAGSAESVEQIQSALLGLKAQRGAIKAQLAEARRQRDEATLRAPFTGTIIDTLMEVGDVAAPGQPVVLLGEHKQMLEMTLMVPEALVARITRGDEATLFAPLSDPTPTRAEVVSVSNQAAPRSGLFPVRLEFDAGQTWRAGMTARAELTLGSRHRGWLVPMSTIVDPSGDDPYVLRVREHIAERVPVKLESLHEEGAILSAELESQDVLITAGHFAVRRGARVEVAP